MVLPHGQGQVAGNQSPAALLTTNISALKRREKERKEGGRKTLFDVEVGPPLKVLEGQSQLLTPCCSTKAQGAGLTLLMAPALPPWPPHAWDTHPHAWDSSKPSQTSRWVTRAGLMGNAWLTLGTGQL